MPRPRLSLLRLGGDAVRTIGQLGNSNCGWCLNAMADQLRARPIVGNVHLNASAGCLVVDH